MRWIALIAVLLGGCRQFLGFEDVAGVQGDAGGGSADASDDAHIDAPVDVSPDALTLAGCPPSYNIISPSGGRYRHVTAQIDWIDAVLDCADDANTMGIHTHLAVFGDDAERLEVHSLLMTTVWIGMTDRRVNGQWTWVTLEPIVGYPSNAQPPWTGGQPDGQDCGAQDENGGLEDRQCDGPDDVPFLCECDFFVDTPSQY